jgi:hypothetical protein
VKVLALILGVAILATGLWAASEAHYGACVSAAEARHPVYVVYERLALGGLLPQGQPKTKQVAVGAVARRRAVAGCSRLPF